MLPLICWKMSVLRGMWLLLWNGNIRKGEEKEWHKYEQKQKKNQHKWCFQSSWRARGCFISVSQSPHVSFYLFSLDIDDSWSFVLQFGMGGFFDTLTSQIYNAEPKEQCLSIRPGFAGEGMTLIGWGNGDWHWLVQACLCGQEVICIMQTFAVCRGSVHGKPGWNIKTWTFQVKKGSTQVDSHRLILTSLRSVFGQLYNLGG